MGPLEFVTAVAMWLGAAAAVLVLGTAAFLLLVICWAIIYATLEG